jgi:hypothetical protein
VISKEYSVAAFVTGIALTQNVDEIEKLLGAIGGLDSSKFVVITKCERTDEHDDSFIEFVHAVSETEGVNALNLGDTGTGVPQIREPGTIQLGYLGHPHVIYHIGNLPIPQDEAENYNDAIDNGRTVVAYPVDGDAASVQTAMHNAGLAHVKTFRS